MQRKSSRQTDDSGKTIKTRIEAEDLLDPVLPHHGQVQGIARGQLAITQNNLLGFFHRSMVNRQNLVYEREQNVKSRLNGLPAIDSYITMQDFLQDFRIRDQSLTLGYEFLEQALSVRLVQMRRPDKIHGDIGIDENHGLLLR